MSEESGAVSKGRILLLTILIAATLFFGSILFILSRAPPTRDAREEKRERDTR